MVIQEVDAQVPEELQQAASAGRHLAQLNQRAGSQAAGYTSYHFDNQL